MKKVLSVLFALMMLSLSALSAFAADVDVTSVGKTIISEGDWVYEAIDGGSHLSVDEYTGSNTELVIPRIVNDRMVTAISNHCFLENTSVTSVVTSSPLWKVGEYAFLKCTSLVSFECNFALNEIATGAFSETTALKSINLEDSVITAVKPLTFLNSGIEQITLPETCTAIMQDAFAQCHQLTSVTIPDSVTAIHEDAFRSSENVVIYCNTDSYAHEYAEAKGISYILLDSPNTVRFLLGDADNDGVVSISDVTMIQRVLAELEQDDDAMIELRVTNGEEKLNIFNATEIQRYLARLSIERTIDIPIIKSLA